MRPIRSRWTIESHLAIQRDTLTKICFSACRLRINDYCMGMHEFASMLGKLKSGQKGAFLAPMSGISDLSLRKAAHYFGATLVISEMVDSSFYSNGDSGNRLKADGDGLDCHVVQIAGCTPGRLAEAAKFAEAQGAHAIDINMGCPAKKVVGGMAGSALMRDLDHATALIRAVVDAASVPVTLKMRLGWDDATRNAAELAYRAEGEGVSLVAVHGRTRCQFYQGKADWSAIRFVVDRVGIPVVANGDCASLADARAMLEQSGAAAVMIGRAAVGRPWLVGDIAHALDTGRTRAEPSAAERQRCALLQYDTLLSLYGADRGVRHARKHLAGYAIHAGYAPDTSEHAALVTEDNPDRVRSQLACLFSQDELSQDTLSKDTLSQDVLSKDTRAAPALEMAA